MEEGEEEDDDVVVVKSLLLLSVLLLLKNLADEEEADDVRKGLGKKKVCWFWFCCSSRRDDDPLLIPPPATAFQMADEATLLGCCNPCIRQLELDRNISAIRSKWANRMDLTKLSRAYPLFVDFERIPSPAFVERYGHFR
jgi:hypothetical protein